MSPVRSRLVVLGVVLTVLVGIPSWSRSLAADAEEEVDLTLSEGGDNFTNSLGMKFVRVRAGKFMMGAPETESGGESSEKPRHEVELTKDFHLGAYEVTQKQYEKVMGKNPSWFCKDGSGKANVQGMDTSDFPVENLTWDEAQEFVKKLNELSAEKSAGRKYRLPTEAEWEYACRGGHKIREIGDKAAALPFHLKKPSESLGRGQANFDSNTPYGNGQKGPMLNRPCPVGKYDPNLVGLYDMHGSAREWVADWFSTEAYKQKNRRDPTGPEAGTAKTTRGGSWLALGYQCRAAQRANAAPTARNNFVGFRVAASASGFVK